MSKSYYFLNLGCPKNQTDGDFVRGTLNELGFEESESARDVDYIFINTCAFIEQARLETMGEIEELLKTRQNGSQVIALGCYPAWPGFENDLEGIDAAFRFDEIEKLFKYITDDAGFCLKPNIINRVVGDSPYAYLVISDGCDNRCSYCSIPNIRGSYRSRRPDRIVEEAEYLARRGVSEIVLVAQDTAIYGRDIEGDVDLPELCRMIAAIEKVKWLRIMYAHPGHLDEAMLESIFAVDKVCRYLDLPIQHISDRVLAKMNRRYDGKHVERIINRLREVDKSISLRTTLMVGFPGETDQDFKKLLDFVESVKFDSLGAFAYSPEKDTSALSMHGRVDQRLAEERLELLLSIAEDQALVKAREQIGKVEKMLIDGSYTDADSYLEARSYRQAPEIDGLYILPAEDSLTPGSFIEAKIIDVDRAEIVKY